MANRMTITALVLVTLYVGCSRGGSNSGPSPAWVADRTPGAGSLTDYLEYLGPYPRYAASFKVPPVCAESTPVVNGFAICVDTVTLDGAAATRAAILQGQLTALRYQNGPTGHTGSIDVRRTVVGPVDSIDAVRAKVSVLGQQIHLIDRSFGDAVDLATLSPGDIVSVSGPISADGQVIATRIDQQSYVGPVLLRGILAAGSNGLFRIGDMQVDLSSAVREGFQGGTPLAGDSVLLFADSAPQGGPLVAQTARYEGGNSYQVVAGQFLHVSELTGFVTATRSKSDFDVAGYTFRPESCASCDTLSEAPAVGAYIRAEIHSGAGSVKLETITAEVDRLTGPVESIDLAGSAITVLGITVRLSPATHIVADNYYLTDPGKLDLADLEVGSTVTIAGGTRQTGGAVLFAGWIGRYGNGVQIMSGDAIEFDDPSIDFVGRSVLTDATTEITYCNCDDDCSVVDSSWLFGRTDGPPTRLTIDIDPDQLPLRAMQILAQQSGCSPY